MKTSSGGFLYLRSGKLHDLPCILSDFLPDHRALSYGGTDRKYFPLRLVAAKLFY